MFDNDAGNIDAGPDHGIVSPLPWKWFIVGLVGLALGGGFYGILFCVLLGAWALDAPNAPTGGEGLAIFCAATFHLTPMALWLGYRSLFMRQKLIVQCCLAAVTWLLIPISLGVMFAVLGP